MHHTLIKKLIGTLAFLIAFTSGILSQSDSLRYYYQKSVEAHKLADHNTFLDAAAAANRLRPNHPTLTYNLAAAHSLNGHTDQAIKYLKKFTLMNSTSNYSEDKDFEPILKEKKFASLLKLQKELSDSINKSKIEFQLAKDTFHPECMTYDPKTQQFFFGGVHQAGVKIYDPSSTKSSIWIDRNTLKELYCVLGIAVDPVKNSLWLVSSALPQLQGYSKEQEGKSSVYEIDLDTKKVLTFIHMDSVSRFGELLFDKGKAFVADGLTNKVYQIQSGDQELKLIADLSKEARNLQGIAINKNQKYLFISDYVSGLFRIKIKDGSFQRVTLPNDVPFKGIDGLFFHNNTLLATQNGSTPMRVMRLYLDSKKEKVEDWSIIDQNLSVLNEPTQGVLLKDAFYYIANSPWQAYDKEMQLQSNLLRPIQIRKYDLKNE